MKEAPAFRADDFRKRLFGEVSKKEILKEIIKLGQKPIGFDINKLSRELNFDDVKELAETAIRYGNLEALLFLARVKRHAVARAASSKDFDKLLKEQMSSPIIPRLYFYLKGEMLPTKRKLFRRIVRSAVLKMSLRISGQGIRGSILRKGEFTPESPEFDIEDTLENIIGKNVIDREDIVTIIRERKRKTGVLILDTSGSMHGDKILNAALAAATLAYHMRHDRYAIIVFNNVATVLKKMDERENIQEVIDTILDTEPVGYTRLDDALEKGLKELNKIKDPRRWAILITDGCYNKGSDPLPIATRYPKLHVIQLPSHNEWCNHVCKKIAKLGKGKLVKISKYSEIPTELLKLLRKP